MKIHIKLWVVMLTLGQMNKTHSNSIGSRIKQLRKAAKLNQRQLALKVGVSEVTIGTWERDIHPPSSPNMAKLAKALNSTTDYMSYGTPLTITKVRHHMYMTLPVISGDFAKDLNTGTHGIAIAWRTTTMQVGNKAYFLQMPDASMHNPSGSPCIPQGAYVLVDPDVVAKTNDIVIAALPNHSESLIKLLIIDGPNKYLKSLNPEFKTILAPEGTQLLGVVRQITQDLP